MEMPEPDCTSHHERCINSLIFLLGAAQSRTLFLFPLPSLGHQVTRSNSAKEIRKVPVAGVGGPGPAGPVCMEVSKTNPIPITATPLFNLNWAQFLLQCKTSVSWRYVHFQGIVFCLSRGVPAVPATSLQSPPLAPAEAFTGGTWCHEFTWWLAWCFAASGHQQTDDDIRAYFAAVADLESRWLTITSWVNVAQKHVLYRFVVWVVALFHWDNFLVSMV